MTAALWRAAAAAAAVIGWAGQAWAEPDRYRVVFEPAVGELDPRLPAYKPPAKLAGKFRFAGSGSMRTMVQSWVAAFSAKCPDVDIDYDPIGSRNAAPALAAGDLEVAVTSQPLTDDEASEFRKNHGYDPVALIPAVEVYAVYVHKENPVRGVSLAEFDGMWTVSRNRGGADIDRWGRLGARGAADKPVTLYAGGRDLVSQAVRSATQNGRPKETTELDEDTGESAAAALERDRFGAALARAGIKRDHLRPLAIEGDDGRPVPPTHLGLRAGYPLVRKFFIYVHRRPGKAVDPVAVEFLRFVFSKDGQEIVVAEERTPVAREFAEDMLRRLK
jgi:phosphate transport system substrate-binding protein